MAHTDFDRRFQNDEASEVDYDDYDDQDLDDIDFGG